MDVKDKRPREGEEETSSPKKRPILLMVLIPLLLGFLLAAGILWHGDTVWEFMVDFLGSEEYEDLPCYQVELDEFVTNPASPGATNYLRLKMHLAFNEGDLEDELEKKNYQIRDRINIILRSKTVEDLQDPGGTEALQEELINELNQMLVSGEIKEVYFEEFIIQ